MHELALCRNLLGIIEQQAEQQAFSEVQVVRLEIGNFAGVEVEALCFAFEVASRGTRVANARLEIIPVPGDSRCGHCQQQVVVRHRFDACPVCGQYGLHISGGDSVLIKALEVV